MAHIIYMQCGRCASRSMSLKAAQTLKVFSKRVVQTSTGRPLGMMRWARFGPRASGLTRVTQRRDIKIALSQRMISHPVHYQSRAAFGFGNYSPSLRSKKRWRGGGEAAQLTPDAIRPSGSGCSFWKPRAAPPGKQRDDQIYSASSAIFELLVCREIC